MKNYKLKNEQEIKFLKKYLSKWNKKRNKKKYRTMKNEIDSKRLNQKPQLKIETLDNKVLPKNTKVEIGIWIEDDKGEVYHKKGKGISRTIDISQYIIK